MPHQPPLLRRLCPRTHLWGLICGLTLAVAQLFNPAGLGTAQAATTACAPNGATQNCTVTFSASGAPESWTVPAGVTAPPLTSTAQRAAAVDWADA